MICTALYCFPLCIINLNFFIKSKLQERCHSFPLCSSPILIWGMILLVAKFFYAFAIACMLPIQIHVNPDPDHPSSPKFNLAYLIVIRTYCYIIDFLIMTTLLYLFYCLGKAAENEAHKHGSTCISQPLTSFR